MSREQSGKESPLMKQYFEIKAQHPDAILLFRVGDFYETFGQDAVRTSKALGIVLTSRSSGYMNDLELAGFPFHALDTYLPRLVKAVGKVAVCEQLEDPKAAKKLVKRGITELLTPGVLLGDKMLDAERNNFLCVLVMVGGKDLNTGIAFVDISTGEFYAGEGDEQTIHNLIDRYQPKEIVIDRQATLVFERAFGNINIPVSSLDDWVFRGNYAHDLLLKHFGVASLKGFGIDDLPLGTIAAGAALHYLAQTKHDKIGQISHVSRISQDEFLWIDGLTARNLNLFEPAETSLYSILNKTRTPMGARLLRRFMMFPLNDSIRINKRYDYVDFWLHRKAIRATLNEHFAAMGDLERLVSKIATLRATPHEMVHLAAVLQRIEKIQELNSQELFAKWAATLHCCKDLREKISQTLEEDPAATPQKGKVIASGINSELDRFYKIAFSGKEYLAELQQSEAKRTGISSLKLGFNNVYGYYLEVTNVHKNKVPQSWIRKQTTTNAERYITEELKHYEQEVLSAQEKLEALQAQIYQELLVEAQGYLEKLQQNAKNIAFMDVMMCYASAAEENHYAKPVITDGNASPSITIKGGRHPIIEKFLPAGEEYIPNDIFLGDNQQILMITGPNMSGKSAVLRQTALTSYMAQIGCFVPAVEAHLSLIDKIFTRVGASDNIAAGESTFMTEMNETAVILNNATSNSLVLLDEIGRGTSTYDGISIAWAIAEYLHENPRSRPLVLFATHYHELNEMAAAFERIKNYHITTREADGRIIFLRKLVAGGSEYSFGIHVARMAGLPAAVTTRAAELLNELESRRNVNSIRSTANPSSAATASPIATASRQMPLETVSTPVATISASQPDSPQPPQTTTVPPAGSYPPPPLETAAPAAGTPAQYQLSLFQLTDLDDNLQRIKQELQAIDINSLSPIEALNKLNEIKRLL
ncbi:MAG: DNA mismatch repair protein MutS [Bacteroidales bacterium]|jgi:DNA mismatch repair protein MutS|nr:DNA mismatch repair protein MutS [Bacteroidales bacterium]